MSDLGLTHIALPVRSLAASTSFYQTYARMQVIHRRHSVVWISDLTRPFAIVLIGNLSAASRMLGLTRPQLAYRLKRLQEPVPAGAGRNGEPTPSDHALSWP